MRGLRLGLALVALAGMGCAANPASRLRTAEKENQRLTQQVQDADRALQSVSAYTEELRSPGKSGRSFHLYFTPAALEQQASRVLPMRMPARGFHEKLSGDGIVERLYDIRFGPGNTLNCRALLRGDNVRYTGQVPKSYQADVKRFQSGVAAGVVADLVVDLTLSDTSLVARASATRTKLQANSSPTWEGMLRQQVNERALRLPFTFDLTIQGAGAVPRRMVLTANHLVVTYAP